MKQLILLSAWLLFAQQVSAQLSASQIDSVRNRLTVSRADSNRVKLLLVLGNYKLERTNQLKANQDSARLLFQQASALSERIGDRKWKEESQCQLGTYFLLTGNLPHGKACFMPIITAYQHEGNKAQESKTWLRMGDGFLRKEENYKEILNAYAQALILAGQLHDRQQEVAILSAIGEVYAIKGDLNQARQEYTRVLAIQKAIADKNSYRTYFSLSNLSFYQGDFNSALAYVLKMIKSLEISGNTGELDYAYFRLGNVYFELGQIDKSVDAYKKSFAISQQKGKVIVDPGMAKKFARALLKQGKAMEALQFLQDIDRANLPLRIEEEMTMAESFGECYAALKQYKQAETYYLESIEWSKKTPSWTALVAYVGISRFYVATNQYAKANPYLSQLLAAPSGQVPANILMEVQLMQFKVDSAAGRYVAAIAHFRQHKALNDSIFSAGRSRQIEELEVQYETEKKEQRIQLLTEKEQLQQSNLEREQTTRNGLLAGAILLAGLLGVSYNRYRLKQRSNQLLQAQQQEINQKNESLQRVLAEKDKLLVEKEWMLKEIHHRVKNNLQIITSLLHSQEIYLKDPAALSAIQESQNRVQVMALIHQKLYQFDRLSSISFAEYMKEIADYLITTFNRQHTVQVKVKAAPVELDVTLAVPLGLIINEAVTNSLKHAFPSGQTGTITIDLTQADNRTYQLTISDNGIGITAETNLSTSRTLGLSLIRGLSKQLGGHLQISQNNGVQIRLTFKAEEIPKEGFV